MVFPIHERPRLTERSQLGLQEVLVCGHLCTVMSLSCCSVKEWCHINKAQPPRTPSSSVGSSPATVMYHSQSLSCGGLPGLGLSSGDLCPGHVLFPTAVGVMVLEAR